MNFPLAVALWTYTDTSSHPLHSSVRAIGSADRADTDDCI